ncbi:hypothetical protein NW754_001507 [Fusarium falciforme]|nr:hypothetical protein NW754_001507 [Fusarium falciforme]
MFIDANYEGDLMEQVGVPYRTGRESKSEVPFYKPAGYNESTYEILFRYIEAGYGGPFFTTQLMSNIKTDSNA